ncbi:MAG TPA: hypothetical protein VF634_00785, partial [Pyrinomonadaceae bacterium]
AQNRTGEAITRLSATQSYADERMAALADAQIRSEAAAAKADEAIARMSARVDRLVETVDRYIEGRNERS